MYAPKDSQYTLNILLNDELAAMQTYQHALDILGDVPGATDLQRIHSEHRAAADTLRVQIDEMGYEPNFTVSVRGIWTGIVEGTAGLLGPRIAAQTLKQGEELGARNYEQALQNDHLPAECKTIIHNCLLPHTREHLATLERILEIL